MFWRRGQKENLKNFIAWRRELTKPLVLDFSLFLNRFLYRSLLRYIAARLCVLVAT